MPFFKDQLFDLNRKGVTLILGKNLDSSNDNPNGAGKSMFFSEMAELITRRPMIGERGDTVRQGSRELTFTKRGHQYKVVRSFSPREKLAIFKDGVDLEYKDLAPTEEALFKLIPYTPQEVLSLLYIDARVPHPLVRGNTSARREFFLRFFKMNAAPTMRKVVKAELDQISVSTGSITELRRQISELKAKIDGRDTESLEARIVKLQARVDALTTKSREYAEVARIYREYQKYRAKAKELRALGITSRKALKLKLREIQEDLRAQADIVSDWKSYNLVLEENKANKLVLADLFTKLPENYVQDPAKWLDRLGKDADVLAAEINQRKRRIAVVKSKIPDCGKRAKADIVARVEKLEASRVDIYNVRDKCPTCGGKWDNSHARDELRAIDKKITAYSDQIIAMTVEYSTLMDELDESSSLLPVEEVQLAEMEKHLSLLKKFNRLRNAVTREPPKKPLQPALDAIKQLEAEQDSLDGAWEALRAEFDWTELSDEQRVLARGEDPTDRLLEVSQKLGLLKGELDEVVELTDMYRSNVKKRRELSAIIEERPVLELLHKALSKGGIDAIMIKAICDRLSQLVNRYSKAIFPEDYQFSFELESQFSFLVTRKYGKRLVTSDVRKLSGAESLLFNLVLYAALMSFVPEANRLNTLVLDEPHAAFGTGMKEAFIEFLPLLNQVVDHIIIITPDPCSRYTDNTKVFTIVKKGGKSTIEEGNFTTNPVVALPASRTGKGSLPK